MTQKKEKPPSHSDKLSDWLDTNPALSLLVITVLTVLTVLAILFLNLLVGCL